MLGEFLGVFWSFPTRIARVTFGDYRLDVGARQVFRGAAEIHLSPKAFELLRLLVENRPRAMSKAELHEQLWPATFVTEANLASVVAEVRRVLHDDPRAPAYIRTVHGFGYAFAGRVEADAPAAPVSQACWIIWRGREIPLADGEHIVGRDRTAAVPLDFPSVSRRHARIVVRGETVTIEDLGSKNGTLVGTKKVTRATPVNDLDEIQVGSVRMTIRVLRGGEPTETVG
jgi:DNA-binding winged helix-turn-helix (wHTH) protein